MSTDGWVDGWVVAFSTMYGRYGERCRKQLCLATLFQIYNFSFHLQLHFLICFHVNIVDFRQSVVNKLKYLQMK